MIITRLLNAALVIVFCCGAVQAADMPVKVPPPPPAWSWAGFYIGLNAGGVFGRTDPTLTITANQAFNPQSISQIESDSSRRINTSGFVGGLHVGYNLLAGPVLFGIEADFEYFNPKGSKSVTTNYIVAPFTYNINQSVSADWLLTLRPRVGVAFDRWLVFGTAGLAAANLKFSNAFSDNIPNVFSNSRTSVSQLQLGVVAGGGIEYAFAPNWLLRGEYLHLEFTPLQVASPETTTAIIVNSTFNHSIKYREDIVRAAVSYKFDPGLVTVRY